MCRWVTIQRNLLNYGAQNVTRSQTPVWECNCTGNSVSGEGLTCQIINCLNHVILFPISQQTGEKPEFLEQLRSQTGVWERAV